MAAWTGTAHVSTVPARRGGAGVHRHRPNVAQPPGRRSSARRRPVTSGVVWIALLGVLLAGVVALNVAVLRLNMGLDRLDQEQSDLHAQNAALQSQLSSNFASTRIEIAARRMGLVPASAQDTGYLDLARR
jgi:hypothetical protein